MDRDDLNGMLWTIADPDKPGVSEDIEEILNEFDTLTEKIDNLEFDLEEERYGDDI